MHPSMISWKIVRVFTKLSVLIVFFPPGKLYVFLHFEKTFPGKFDLLLSYVFPAEKSYMFLWNFEKALLEEILTCSSTFCLSWKIYMCSCTKFGSSGKFDVFL